MVEYYRSNPPTHGHKHHVLPKSLGGSNKKSNLVLVPIRSHFILHKLLFKMMPDIPEIQRAYYLMCRQNCGSSKEYEKGCKHQSEMMKVKNVSQMPGVGDKISKAKKGVPCKKSTKDKISKTRKNRGIGKGKNNGRYDSTLWCIIHKDGRVLCGTMYQLRKIDKGFDKLRRKKNNKYKYVFSKVKGWTIYACPLACSLK